MRSLLKNNTILVVALLFTGTLTTSLNAADESKITDASKITDTSKPTVTDKPADADNTKIPTEIVEEPYVDVYPTYPPTHSATGDEETLIKRGEYLAKMGDCISCHTDVKGGSAAYSGGLPIDTPFGTFYSPNITPDKETGIGNWTEEDFIRALKKGRNPKGQNYFPVFPYVYFAKMSTDDIRALYAYFMSIPAVKQTNKSLPFPFNIPGARFSLWGWNLLFFYPESTDFVYDEDQSAAWNRGKYIVDTLGHCSMCHTPLNIFGAPKNSYYLTGSFVDGYWAPNITKFGLHTASHVEVANVFINGQLINRAGPVTGPMAEVNHNSLAYMTDEDKLAIATYLKTVISEEPLGLPGLEAEPTLKRGKQVYVNACIICHQNGTMSAPLNGNGPNWYKRLKASGLTGLYRHVIRGYNSMPVKGACVTCSDNDLIAATDYILNNSLSRSEWHDLAKGGEAKYPANGKDIYNENCAICHDEGKEGAPKIGDKAAWKPLIEQNMDVLYQKTLSSEDHPKNGGCKLCSTGELLEAIKYIVSKSKSEGNYSLW